MRPTTLLQAGVALAAPARAWHQPVAHPQPFWGQQHPLSSLPQDADDDVDIVTGSQFHGLKTFANLPYVNALADEGAEYDIAILGAPFDTATSGRPGARFGPAGIRTGSQRMFPDEISIYTGQSTLNLWAKVVDTGDVGLTWFDNSVALRQLDKAHRVRRWCEIRKVAGLCADGDPGYFWTEGCELERVQDSADSDARW